jgi:hypothetical protein
MPNAIAYLVLIAWPVVTIVLFRKLPADRALIWTLLGGYLFLPPPPAGFDFPLLPPLEKDTIPSIAALLVLLSMHGLRGALLPETLLGRVLVGIFILSPALTAFTNMEPIYTGEIWLPPLSPKDALSLTIQQFLLLLPFLLARQFLASGGSQKALLQAFAVAGLVYSLPMLLEVRLAPQLNIWIYGYFQHSFEQMIRFRGFRPIVFLYHGLWAAFLALTAVVAAMGLWRVGEGRNRALWLAAGAYMIVVLILCKSVASLAYALLLVPLVMLLGARMQIRVAALIALMAVSYPVLKGAHAVPQDMMLAQAQAIDADRAASLEFRFRNEDMLLAHAEQKPLFGWGGWGRNHVYGPDDHRPLTVADGRWIITLGIFGYVGLLAEFGLIFLPILMMWREALIREGEPLTPYVGPLTLILAINLVDMLPNATMTPMTWLIAGALWGLAEARQKARLGLDRRREPVWRSVM